MAGKKSRNKSYRGEKEFRDLAKEKDLYITWHNNDPKLPGVTVEGLTGEIKYRKSVPKTPYKWLEQDDADFIAMKRVEGQGKPARDWLVLLRLDDFWELMINSRMKAHCVNCGKEIPLDKDHHQKYGNACKECALKSREIGYSPSDD